MRRCRRLVPVFLLAAFGGGCGARTTLRPGGPAPVSTVAPASSPAVTTLAPSTRPPRAICTRVRPGEGALPFAPVRQSSPIALAQLGAKTVAYIADEDERALHTVDVDARSELAVTPLAGSPSHLLVLADGRIAVTLRDANRVVILEPFASPSLPLEERCSTAVAIEPVAMAASPDDRRIVISSGYGHTLTGLAAFDLGTLFTVDLPREPRAVVLSGDGQRAFVAHVVGGLLSVVDLDGPHAVRTIDVRAGGQPLGAARANGEAPPLRKTAQGFALAMSGEGAGASRLFAPLVSVDPGEPKASQGYGGADEWGPPPEAPMVRVIDPEAENVLGVGEPSGRHTGECLLPRAAVLRDPATLLVTCLGIDALLELDARAASPLEIERRRFRVPEGPTGAAIDPRVARAIVWSAFAHTMAIVDLAASAGPTVQVPLARREGSALTPTLARGRVLFHATFDPRISRDGRACASCHPDGRDDALTWSTPNGPRQTISLAGRVAGSAPYGWFGASATLATHVTHSLARLGGQGLTDPRHREDFQALLAYVATMPGPSRAGAPLDPARVALAERGRALFQSPRQGCAECHGDGAGDRQTHDVKSGNVNEVSLLFDTPSLRFVGNGAPYFHDGRYRTLEELIRKSDGAMGHTTGLDADQVKALAAYLDTL